MPKKIIIVDDEKDIVDLINYNLEKEGFVTIKAYDGESALELIKVKKPDMVLLDLMLPGIRGLEVCKFIRKNPDTETLPIIMLTAKGDQVDKILGFEMGADDYVAKPFNVRELIARVRAVLRRAETRPDSEKREQFAYRGLEIDYSSYEVTIDGKKIDLGPKELKLLQFLTRHPGRVYTRDQLLDYVWGDEAFVEPRTVDVHVSNLRSAIEKDKAKPRYILTVRGIGYKFADLK
jgi:phosphate regulon transcriptional regulator PhoB